MARAPAVLPIVAVLAAPALAAAQATPEAIAAEETGVIAGALAEPATATAVGVGVPRPLWEGQLLVAEGVVVTAPKQIASAELKLQWREERYAAGGPDGLLIDGNGMEVGVNYKLRSMIVVGALAQFNPAGETLFRSEPSLLEHGWMAGPVATVRFTPNLVLDARVAWGLAETGQHDLIGAQRRLVSAKLANAQSFGAWRFTPSVNLSHLWETVSMPGALATELPAPHAAGSGRIDIGPELAYRVELAPAAFLEPRAAVGGFWGFDSLTKLAPGTDGGQPDLRLKAEAGVTIGIVDGPKLQASGGVEEGRGAPDAWTGRVQLSVPLK